MTGDICINKNNDEINSINENYVKNGLLFNWKICTVNIRSGKEQSEGAKMYIVTKPCSHSATSSSSL